VNQPNGTEQWQPPRGPVFRIVVWTLLALIVLGSLAGLIVGLLV
jgi:hypothetical protein